ncbi:hypothetical protein NS226_20510 [Aureimonas ureilytica]|uniref:FAD-dependent urate hydroxylase HpyO/Asp monooxygenase CreE-like FAD/NAD(P)-binding domain-containing protein n=1 Tax=Aureimonas ureilytica TaxID=401562 RepID=A0A175R518_9HYPH|nr:FAD-dependent oxidoreductase [Aureimonas ureilytica]KTQ85246.1 hypothetical protein NS226_20510 [Aureimonas ureilytica]
MTRRPAEHPPVVAIIGGGFSGAALAYHLARRPDSAGARIIVVEPRERLGAGLAYSSAEPSHRINVPAGRMSLDTAEPDQFARWLEGARLLENGERAASDVYAQRGLFGRYVHEALTPLVRAGRIEHCRARAERITRETDGRFRIQLSDTVELTADILALATTHPLPAVPSPLARVAQAKGFLADPYDPAALAAVPDKARVLIVGNGLTSADMVATLDRLGHRGSIVTLSRNGLRSRGHALRPVEARGDFTSDPETSAVSLLRRIRREIEAAGREGLSWHGVLDAVRSQGQAIWQGLPERERARIVRHLRTIWDVHRFRIAPEVEATLERMERDGRLRRIAATLTGAEAVADGFDVKLRPRRSVEVETQRFDVIVNTTGPAHRSIIAAEPARSLHEADLIALDRVGLGLATARDGSALGSNGEPVEGLFIAGPLARGTFGELMGLPQVTAYAEHLAETLVHELARREPAGPHGETGSHRRSA